jgi:hypothetical protein
VLWFEQVARVCRLIIAVRQPVQLRLDGRQQQVSSCPRPQALRSWVTDEGVESSMQGGSQSESLNKVPHGEVIRRRQDARASRTG